MVEPRPASLPDFGILPQPAKVLALSPCWIGTRGLAPLPAVQCARPTRPAAPQPSVKVDPGWPRLRRSDGWGDSAQLKCCREEPDEDAVHELRVATRRLIAKLFLLTAVVPGPAPARARRLLKERLDALGELRDVHVMRLFFDAQTTAFPELILVRDALARLEGTPYQAGWTPDCPPQVAKT